MSDIDQLRATMDFYMKAARDPCWYCGLTGSLNEHQTPRSRGGIDGPPNLVWACQSCNTLKGDRTLEEFRAVISERLGVERWVFHGEK